MVILKKLFQNAQWLVRKLMAEFNIPIENIKQHYDWNGKNCPYTIRKTPNGWKNFLDGLKDKPKEDNTSKVLYRVQTGAFKVKSNADKLAAELKRKVLTPILFKLMDYLRCKLGLIA